jgi:guanine deaminase
MDFAQRTIDLARQNVIDGGRPFATVIVKDGGILAESANKVAQSHDPTAHAEILAVRAACMKLGTEHLTGATIYVLAHPCPMCLGSLYYCSPDQVVFLTQRDQYEFSKDWQDRRLPMRYDPHVDAIEVYREWRERNGDKRPQTLGQ